MITFASISDLHLTNELPHTPQGDTHRKDMLELYISDFFREIKRKRVDFLIIPGDICHSSSLNADDIDLVYILMQQIVELNIPTIISIGNHDLNGDSSILSFLYRVREKFSNVLYSQKLYWREVFVKKDTTIDVINFCQHDDFINCSKLLAKKKITTSHSILVGHVGVKGALHGSTKSILGLKTEDIEEIQKRYDVIVLGHFHCFQWITDKCFYVGSCQQTRLDELSTDPGGIIMTVPGLRYTRIINEVSPRFSLISDYSLDVKKIKGKIVKLLLDLEGKSESENLKYIQAVHDLEPYHLIRPRVKKIFTTDEAGVVSFGKKNKTRALLETMKSFMPRNKDKEFYTHTIDLWNKFKN